MSTRALRPLAAELSTCWRELGSILASRRLHSSLHPELGKKLTPSKLRGLELLAQQDGLRVGELADRVGVDDTTATRLVSRLADLQGRLAGRAAVALQPEARPVRRELFIRP